MQLIRSVSRMAALSRRLEQAGQRIGVVPTMGALHAGHASLIRAARARNDVVVVTIFVNPLQFGPGEDFARYPRALARDLRVAKAAGADLVFAPSAGELYPAGFQTVVDVGAIAALWEGRLRPGHFRGVATVVAVLFGVTRPTNAYFGQKDYQQTVVIRRVIDDLRLSVRLHVVPTVREADGLAMSSRNAYLSPEERRRAAALWGALQLARAAVKRGERRAAALIGLMRGRLAAVPGARIDYIAVADPRTLQPLRRLIGCAVLLLAVRVGRTRLIDNLLVDVT